MKLLITDDRKNVVDYDLVIDLRTDKKINDKNVVSIFNIIEENADDIRTEILIWLDSFNNMSLFNKDASKALDEFKSKNLWQINRLNERCNFGKLDQLDNVFKIFAINYFLKKNTHYKIFLNIKSNGLNKEITNNLLKQGVYLQNLLKENQSTTRLAGFQENNVFMHLLKSFPWIVIRLYEVLLIKFNLNPNNLKDAGHSSFFFTYFSQNDFEQNLNYENSYWGQLPKNLLKEKSKVCWIYIYAGQKKELKAYCSKLNSENTIKNNSIHIPIESFISPFKIIKCYFKWVKMSLKGMLILRDKNLNKYKYFSFIRRDLNESLCGIELLNNIIYEETISSLVKSISDPKKSFYLHENQSWEYFLRLHWCKTHRSSLSGFAHSYIRFWDLRYFYPKNFHFNNQNSPKFLLCTSRNQLNAMKNTGYPKEKLKLVESLRYTWIERKYFKSQLQPNILISGDYKYINNKKLFSTLPKSNITDISSNYYFLPHPSSSISKIQRILPEKVTIISKDQISDLNFQLAIVSNLTAACIDYKILGIPTIYYYNELNLNLSPLRNINSCKSFNGRYM